MCLYKIFLFTLIVCLMGCKPSDQDWLSYGKDLTNQRYAVIDEINDKNVFIVPKDSGFNDEEKLNKAIREIKSKEIKIVIGPITHEEFNYVKKHNDLIFISPSNINAEFIDNIISVGVSLESQLLVLTNFIKKQKKNKTVIMFPDNQYKEFIEDNIKKIKLNNIRTFVYNPDPRILTGEIEILTNYSQRKRNLKLRKKMFEDKDDTQSIKEL